MPACSLGGAINDPTADRAALEREFAVNVGGVVAVRATIPFLGEGGRIITIGSIAGDENALGRRRRRDSATKAAVAAYTRGWADSVRRASP